MRKIVVSFLLVILPLTIIQAQQAHTRDSLLQLLANAKEDTNKVNLLFRLGEEYVNSNPDSAKQFIQASGELSKKIGFTKGRQIFYRRIGYVFAVQSQYDSVLHYSQLGLEVAKNMKDTFSIGVCIFNIGIAYRHKSDYENAINYNLEGARLLEGKGYTQIESSLYDGLQVLYMTLSQYDKAIEYGEKAVAAGRLLENKNPLAVALNNIALSYMEVNRLNDAKEVLIEAIAVAAQVDNKSVEGAALNNLAEIAIREGKFEELKKYGEQSLRIHEQINSLEAIAISKRCLAIYYLSQQNFVKAKSLALEALKLNEENEFLSEESQCLNTLSHISFAMRDYTTGYTYSLKSNKIEADIFNESLSQKEAMLKVRYETENKDKQIKLQQAELQKRRIINYVLIGAGLTLLMISFLFYRNYKQKQKLQQQRISELETEKQLTATEAVLKGEEQERTRLAKDLHDGLGGMLSGIKYSFTTMRGNLVMTPENQQAFERSMDMLDSSIKEMRRVAHNMMPEALVKFGLETALKDFCNDINQSGALQITYQSLGLENVKLDATLSITIYRIIQELINNTMKHSGANTAIVQVTHEDGKIGITVEDDGKGFDVSLLNQSRGMGWNNIQSRVDFLKGKLDVKSDSTHGTSVHIDLTA